MANTFDSSLKFILLLSLINLSYSITFEEYVTLTLDQKKALDQLVSRVANKVPHDYMREEIYLIRLLRETDFNVQTAESLLMDILSWRAKNKIDDLINPETLDEFQNWAEEWELLFQGCDKLGRPVVSANVGEINVRQLIMSGQTKKLHKFINAIYEYASRTVNQALREGHNISHATVILDVKGFALVVHGCPLCINFYIHALTVGQSRYPGYLHRIYVINVPVIALPIWNTIKPFLTSKMRDVIEIHGVNKAEWSNVLLKDIDETNLSPRFGGTKIWAVNVIDFLRSGKTFSCNIEEAIG